MLTLKLEIPINEQLYLRNHSNIAQSIYLLKVVLLTYATINV